ncbi:MAG TPA: type II toxin-antitoxin system Phd/YefM family antitoxin [Chloroflexia bacterium]|nr:type II toxin-antitoxin system Phd/YefM family antitoxin [Chloroflexia bacterium]
MPRIISATEATNQLGSVVNWVLENQDEVIIESKGEPTVVIMPYSEYEKLKVPKEQQHRQREQAVERMKKLRDEVRASNGDITTDEEADALANRFVRDVISDMVEEGY